MLQRVQILNVVLILCSLIGYLEWGDENHNFVAEIELQILSGLLMDFKSMIHPLILLPLFGQILLLVSLFSKKWFKWLTYSGIISIWSLYVLLLFIGFTSGQMKIFLFALPFNIIAIVQMFQARKYKTIRTNNA
ncbi:MAG: hypothetical protein H6605_02200 [Flavobacteriales bacterium]|nr:hypothetical protein [Flavobacteriales bacterium]